MAEQRVLFTPGDHVRVYVNEIGHPALVYLPHPDFGAAPGLWLGLEFSIQQARDIAQGLIRAAAMAELNQNR